MTIADVRALQALEIICSRLSERTATLFLGAGINAGLRNEDGEQFPLGSGLSRWIARDLLDSPSLEIPLEEAAEIAIHKIGERELTRYIAERFADFQPGTAHLTLVQLPW